ncbi:MAG: glycyl-radical enzyme activating protein [Kiritimatiellae bacterium]|nr:glycyl-radical enzyme activating protein [Kiritimatiellia bacterium]
MQGIVFDIKRGVTKDGPGFRTSVFLKGCPLRCAWCHNPESQSPEVERAATTGEVCGREMSEGEVMDEVRRDRVFYASSGGGMTLTGGEPTMQPEFALALAGAARAEGIGVALDTCGFAPWAVFERLLPFVDLFLYDLKCMDAARHRELTGADNAPILGNLRRLDAAGAKLWIRCPLVPGLNDSDSDLAALGDFVHSLRNVQKAEICPYHTLGLEKYAKFGRRVPPSVPAAPAAPADVVRWRRAGVDFASGI